MILFNISSLNKIKSELHVGHFSEYFKTLRKPEHKLRVKQDKILIYLASNDLNINDIKNYLF